MSEQISITITEIVEQVSITIIEGGDIVNVVNEETPEQVSIVFTEVGKEGEKGEKGDDSSIITKVAGEAIPSHTPVALFNNLAYKLDASNPLHQFAYVGFSTNGSSLGQNCIIRQLGEIELIGWGLVPNQQYLVGVGGALITSNNSSTNFTKVVGYALTANKMNIIKDFITINK